MITKLEVYQKAKDAYIMDYDYQMKKVKKFQKKANQSTTNKEHWQKLADDFTTEANGIANKIIDIIDLISHEISNQPKEK